MRIVPPCVFSGYSLSVISLYRGRSSSVKRPRAMERSRLMGSASWAIAEAENTASGATIRLPSLHPIEPVSRSSMTMSRLALALGLALAANATRAASIDVQVRDAGGAALADAAVYAVPASGGTETRTGRAAIEPVDREFGPYGTVIQ